LEYLHRERVEQNSPVLALKDLSQLLVPLGRNRPRLSFRKADESVRQPDVRHVNAYCDAVPRTIIEFLFRPSTCTGALARRRDEPTSETDDDNPGQEQHTQVMEESPEQ
jgi:hypothetical protein